MDPQPSSPPHLPLVSATQIQLWRDCKRKWGFKYLDRLVTPTHPAAALGTEVQDEQLDPWLGEGRGFDFSRPSGEIAQALVPLLPRPMTPGMRLRRKFTMPSPTGRFWYQGEFDIYAADSACVPLLDGGGGRPLLGDIKTTSNLDYALTENTLATNVQAQLYAMAVMFEENVNELDLVWFYARTRKPHRVQRTHLMVYAPHVAEQFAAIDETALALTAVRLAAPKTEDLPPNARMCEQYGGCPYRANCNLSPSVHAAAVNQEEVGRMEQVSNNFLAGLRKSPVIVNAAPAVVQAPPAQPVAQPEPEAALPAWATAPVDPLTGHRAAAINPPESSLPPAPPVGAAAPAPAAEPKKRGRQPKAVAEAAVEAAVMSAAGTVASVVGGGDFPRAEFAAFLRAWADRLEVA